jgi:hypothetical protein
LLEPARIEIAAWDDHPNARGHRRLFLALARAVVKDPEFYHMLFHQAPDDRPKTPPRSGRASEPGQERVSDEQQPPAGTVSKFTKQG